MKKKKTVIFLIVFTLTALVLGILLAPKGGQSEAVGDLMRDLVLHEEGKVSLFGLIDVNPALIGAIVVNIFILLVALVIRIFLVPKFTYVPGKAQILIESWVGYFYDLAKKNSPTQYRALGPYIFAAGTYIFIGTIAELFGLQIIGTKGTSLGIPAPLSDVNAALAMGFLSYGFILVGATRHAGLKGLGSVAKDFSLPISMSFRLFGALLGGLLVTELVYYSLYLSFVLPIVVALLFTILHALVQAYVLTLLVSIFYGEGVEAGG